MAAALFFQQTGEGDERGKEEEVGLFHCVTTVYQATNANAINKWFV